MNSLTILAPIVLGIAVIAAILLVPYILATKAKFLYGFREGFVSLLYDGVSNGSFARAVGSMRGKIINPDGSIIDSESPTGHRRGIIWLGIWPYNGAMAFDTEQTKIINNPDGSLGLQVVKFPGSIYIPIVSTERLLIMGLQLSNNAKVNLDLAITYEMVNAYTAKIFNRGAERLLKMNAEEGTREMVSGLDYDGKDGRAAVLTIKNATGKDSSLDDLRDKLNSADCGGGKTLGEVTGYKIRSLNLLKVALSNPDADKVFLLRLTAKETAEASEITNLQEAKNIARIGVATAGAKALMVDQTLRRIVAQKDLSPEQALAIGLENTNAQVVNIGGGNGGGVLLNLSGDHKKKEEQPK